MIVKNVNEVKEIKAHGEAVYRYLYMRKDIYGRLNMEDILKSLGGFWQTTVYPNKTLEEHMHENHEQIYFILRGGGVLRVGDEERKVKPGDAIYIPPKTPHSFYNDGEEECIILMVDAIIDTETKS